MRDARVRASEGEGCGFGHTHVMPRAAANGRDWRAVSREWNKTEKGAHVPAALN